MRISDWSSDVCSSDLQPCCSKENMDMRTIDLSPLYRASVGFDRLFQTLDSVSQESALSYPPYNIEKVSEDAYRIVMAVAGFGEGELDVTAKENSLVITGSKAKPEEGPQEDPQEHKIGR